LGYSRRVLRDLMLKLKEVGVDGVIIGSTALMLHQNLNEFEDDIDIFVTNFSPYVNEDLVRSIANKLGCDIAQTMWGTPALYCIFNDDEVTIELHENVLDLYIPESIIKSAKELKVMDVRVKVIGIEDYIVLKARAGRDHDLEDLKIIAEMVRRGDLKVNINNIMRRVREDFTEEEKTIVSRLREAGFKL